MTRAVSVRTLLASLVLVLSVGCNVNFPDDVHGGDDPPSHHDDGKDDGKDDDGKDDDYNDGKGDDGKDDDDKDAGYGDVYDAGDEHSGHPHQGGTCCTGDDTDYDGVADKCDVCPNDKDPLQKDTDYDGVGDVCDNCKDVKNADQADRDYDGVGDYCDNCPDKPNPQQTDSDYDGKGDACQDSCDGKWGKLILKKDVRKPLYDEDVKDETEFWAVIESTGYTPTYKAEHKVSEKDPLYVLLAPGTYRISEKYADGYELKEPVEVKVEPCKDVEKTLINWVKKGKLVIKKDVRKCAEDTYECDAQDATVFSALIKSTDGKGVEKYVDVSEAYPATVELPVGDYVITEPYLPKHFKQKEPVYVRVDLSYDKEVKLVNLIKKGKLVIKKDVCHTKDDCAVYDSKKFVVRIKSTGSTPTYEGVVEVGEGYPAYLDVLAGTYHVTEDATDGYQLHEEQYVTVEQDGYSETLLKNLLKGGKLTLKKDVRKCLDYYKPECDVSMPGVGFGARIQSTGDTPYYDEWVWVAEDYPVYRGLPAGTYLITEAYKEIYKLHEEKYVTVPPNGYAEATLVNLVKYGTLRLKKQVCLANGSYYEACEETYVPTKVKVKVEHAGYDQVPYVGEVELGDGEYQDLYVPAGDYRITEVGYPPALQPWQPYPLVRKVSGDYTEDVLLVNILKLGTITVYKEVKGCAYDNYACQYASFGVKVDSTGSTPYYTASDYLAPGSPLVLYNVPYGTYKAVEKKEEGYRPSYEGGVMDLSVPDYATWTIVNHFDESECYDGYDNDYDGYSDCQEEHCKATSYCKAPPVNGLQ